MFLGYWSSHININGSFFDVVWYDVSVPKTWDAKDTVIMRTLPNDISIGDVLAVFFDIILYVSAVLEYGRSNELPYVIPHINNHRKT